MKKVSKILSALTSVALAIGFTCNFNDIKADAITVTGDGGKVVTVPGGYTASGHNYWYLTPSILGDSTTLYVGNFTTAKKDGGWTSEFSYNRKKFKAGWYAAAWAYLSNPERLKGVNGSQSFVNIGNKVNYDIHGVAYSENGAGGKATHYSGYSLAHTKLSGFGNSESYNKKTVNGLSEDMATFAGIANKLNRVKKLTGEFKVNAMQVKMALDDFFKTKVFQISNPNKDKSAGNIYWYNYYKNTCGASCGVLMYDADNNGKLSTGDKILSKIELNEIVKTKGKPSHTPIPKQTTGAESQKETMWVLKSLVNTMDGTKFNAGSNGISAYNSKSNFKTSSTSTNSGTAKALWTEAKNLSNEVNEKYSITSNDKTTATYIQLQRVRGRGIVYTYNDIHKCTSKCNTNCTVHEYKSTPDKVEYQNWGDWTYSINAGKVKTIDLTKNASYTVNEPNYKQYNWLDLTTENYLSNNSLLVSAYSKPSNFKNSSGSAGDLNASLTTYKDKGKKFQILSDNNAKKFSINFNKNTVFGVPFSTFTKSKNGNIGNTYLLGSKLYYGPEKNPSVGKTPLISNQRIEPASTSENTGKQNLTFDNQTIFTNKFRSIKFGDYELGDASGTNYWYQFLELATTNAVGTKYNGAAVGKITGRDPNTSDASLSSANMNTKVDLSATFVQPVLQGKIEVKDAAGNY